MTYKTEYELLEGFSRGDYVLVEGMREEYPFRLCYYCTTAEYDGEGDLYLLSTGPEMDQHHLIRVINCSTAMEHIT